MSTHFEAAMAKIAEIKTRYARDRAAFVPGEELIDILTALGSMPESIEGLKKVSEGMPPDPTLDFRKSRSGRFCFDAAAEKIYRTEFQPFTLTAEEDFVRHDSGKIRHFAELDEPTQGNQAFQALLLFKYLVTDDMEIVHRTAQDYESANWICTAFHVRTTTTPELTGEPALEGVHSDGVDHTMTVLLGCENMTEESAVTRIHDMREQNAIRWSDTDPELALGDLKHRHFLDTILIVDHERKHSVSTLMAEDPEKPAKRDMFVFFTRKPALPGHASYQYDSVDPHQTLPMDVELRTPARI